jgi:hypothetical protein
MKIFIIGVVGLFLSGCIYNEEIEQTNLTGKVRISVDVLKSMRLIDADGAPILENGFTLDADGKPVLDISDQMGLLGPVYIGAFPDVKDDLYDYPHPEMGPILDDNLPGNTYPYGGTSVGRFDYACYEQLRCKVVTGRYADYGDIIDFFTDVVQSPIMDPDGNEVTSAVNYQEHCYQGAYVTSNDELSFVDDDPTKNDEPYFKPYFHLSSDGEYFEADVSIPHTLFVKGMKLWGWVDMPSADYNFASCNPESGDQYYRYTEQFMKGSSYPDLLNFPGIYIDEGDWVAEPVEITDPEEQFVIELTHLVEG